MAMVTRAARQRAADETYCRVVCECGHPAMNHFEHRSETPEWRDGVVGSEIIMVPNPDYRPLLFVCRADGCDCEVQR